MILLDSKFQEWTFFLIFYPKVEEGDQSSGFSTCVSAAITSGRRQWCGVLVFGQEAVPAGVPMPQILSGYSLSRACEASRDQTVMKANVISARPAPSVLGSSCPDQMMWGLELLYWVSRTKGCLCVAIGKQPFQEKWEHHPQKGWEIWNSKFFCVIIGGTPLEKKW